ncbi:hypothetical protein GJV76_15225 [Myroides sp. BIT-d1]|uniref:Thioredoxin domain-containing protein n=2 Tax=Flavobacteriaceae TaxID=49546 RepID=A0A6I3LRX4_9FLAO|nr:hypothetical protein [Myroides albus]MTG99451.1 hypothetical protein [Myroides albus]
MKKRNLFKFAMLFALFTAFLTFTSCSSDDNTKEKDEIIDPKPDPDPTPNPDPKETNFFKHKTLVEDYTSVGCPACPYAAFILDELQTTSIKDKIITVTVHDDYGSTKDPYRLKNINDYVKLMKPKFLPSIYWVRDSKAWALQNNFIDGEDTSNGPRYFINQDAVLGAIEKLNIIKEKSNIGIKI